MKIMRRSSFGNACYHSVQNLLCSRLLSNNIKIKIHKTMVLPVVSYRCETFSLALMEEHGQGVFENMALWNWTIEA
jgi:hypothetical protein